MITKFPKAIKFLKGLYLKTREFYYEIFKLLFKVDDKTVIFSSFSGGSYSCNPRYIYEKMKGDARFDDWTFIWVNNDKTKPVRDCINVKYMSIKFFYRLAKSKYWIFNSLQPKVCEKRKGQIYLQTWHGTPLKKLAHDIQIGENATFYRTKISYAEMTGLYDTDVRRYDYMISPGRYASRCFKSAFGIDERRLIETGYPRNDVLINSTDDDVTRIKTDMGLPLDRKIILYAPTWRDNVYSVSGYNFEPLADFKRWQEELGKDCFIIYKPHYLISNDIQNGDADNFIYFSAAADNINDLYLVSDMLITDYSSVFFDYAALRRPIIFYMFDKKTYADELRGFYFDINILPGSIIELEDDLLEEIKSYVDRNFVMDREASEKYDFFVEKYCGKEDGKSCERVIDTVFKEEC